MYIRDITAIMRSERLKEEIISSLLQEKWVKPTPSLANLILKEFTGSKPLKDKIPILTSREKVILEQIRQGKGNKEIALILNISPETVKAVLKKIFKKLQVKNRSEAAMSALEQGLL